MTGAAPVDGGGAVAGAGTSVIDAVEVHAYRVPTTLDGRIRAEQDGTADWNHTDVLVVRVHAGEATGMGYSYTSTAAAGIVRDVLTACVVGTSPHAVPTVFRAMTESVRNLGWDGVAAAAVSAVDVALHDLRARLLGIPLLDLLGRARESVPGYGSGGFTNESDAELRRQLEEWCARGFGMVKMKVGRDRDRDLERVTVARAAVGPAVQLFVDANGAYGQREAVDMSHRFVQAGDIRWFEEPVSSDDIDGLAFVRSQMPAQVAVAAGEYVYRPAHVRRLLRGDHSGGGALDVLQVDATRCGGVTGFLAAAAQFEAAGVPMSAHTAPALHAVLGCAAQPVVHIESFHDHELIEAALFDGIASAVEGRFEPRRDDPGLGLRVSDGAARFEVSAA